MEHLVNFVIAEKYRADCVIRQTSSGMVYHGTDTNSGKQVEIKLEYTGVECPQLANENEVHTLLQGSIRISGVLYYCPQSPSSILVLDHFGPSLETLLLDEIARPNLFNMYSSLATQMISRVELLHDKSSIHRNLSLQSFCIGNDEQCATVHITNLSLAKQYYDPKTDSHIPFDKGQTFIGNILYASINAHCGFELSRRDDMESLGYVLLHLKVGGLVWHDPREIATEKRILAHTDMLSGTPAELKSYFKCIKSLSFSDRPNYDYLRSIFQNPHV